ncbi:uncharacterized protein LOC122851145 [Aphidius gifuensis]|uniref:uncharacterized protein LOC122851145 n=1 Tax=Aphidius gifuensis TaxID=684658 RepID=UPI001CDC17CD|nr:uncharacterized protein LOC122851145 [Aphidius gifuensis]
MDFFFFISQSQRQTLEDHTRAISSALFDKTGETHCHFSYIGNNDEATMNYIKLKIFVGILLIHLIDQIYCETNTLEGEYETGREILLSIAINHENTSSIFAKINEEYDDLTNKFNDANDKGAMNFIELSKKQISSEVNIQAHNLNKISLDEQSKYEDFIRKNIQGFKEKISTTNNCFENNNPLNKILRCIDQYQNSQNKFNTIDNSYSNTKNAFNMYNSILITKIKVAENNFTATINQTMSIEKIINDEFIKRKSSISIPSTSSTKTKNRNLSLLSSRIQVNDTLKNLYVNHTRWLNSVEFKNWIAIQSIRFFRGCVDPDNAYNFKPERHLRNPEISQSVSHIVYS